MARLIASGRRRYALTFGAGLALSLREPIVGAAFDALGSPDLVVITQQGVAPDVGCAQARL
jgi:hypothetical protein